MVEVVDDDAIEVREDADAPDVTDDAPPFLTSFLLLDFDGGVC